jgi:hypothetical protein
VVEDPGTVETGRFGELHPFNQLWPQELMLSDI